MYGNKQPGRFPVWVLIFCLAARIYAAGLADPVKDWQAGPDTASARVVAEGIEFPFAFSASVDRNYWDLSVQADWSRFDGLSIRYRLENPQAVRAITLYLQSGDVWLSFYLPVTAGLQHVFIPFSRFEALAGPGDFSRISTLRLSPWRGEGIDESGHLTLFEISPIRTRILHVDPEEGGSLNAAEWQYGLQLSSWMAGQFSEMGFPVARFPDQEAAALDLSRFDLVVLPYNAYPSAALLKTLKKYVTGGGRLLVCYTASEELASLAGFRMKGHLPAPHSGSWQRMRFASERWPGPAEVQQPGTNNLILVAPGEEAEVLAYWADASGRRQLEPAVLRSETAVWFTAVLTPEDALTKQQMLAGLVDSILPELALPETAVRNAQQALLAQAGFKPDEKSAAWAEVDALLRADKPFEAWAALMEVRSGMSQALAADFQAPAFAMRGIWDANETGRAEDDWPARMARYAEAGITDVFVHIPRASVNPIRPIRAAAAYGIKIHAWHICWQVSELSPTSLRRYEREGRLQVSASGEVFPWLCPSHPENQSSELRRVTQLADSRDLSGVHLDYVRWQDGVFCVCDSCKKSFTAYLKKTPKWPEVVQGGRDHAAFLKWRALQISGFVKKVSSVMKDQYPEIQLSAAVWPAVESVSGNIGQDWALWVKNDWLDFIVPMNYTDNLETFKNWLRTQHAITGRGMPLMAGIGYMADGSPLNVPQVLEQFRAAGEAGAKGFILFKQNAAFEQELAPVLKTIYGSGGRND